MDPKKAAGTGCAFWCPSEKYSETFMLPNMTWIYNAEAFAILKAIHWGQDNEHQHRVYHLFRRTILSKSHRELQEEKERLFSYYRHHL